MLPFSPGLFLLLFEIFCPANDLEGVTRLFFPLLLCGPAMAKDSMFTHNTANINIPAITSPVTVLALNDTIRLRLALRLTMKKIC